MHILNRCVNVTVFLIYFIIKGGTHVKHVVDPLVTKLSEVIQKKNKGQGRRDGGFQGFQESP